MSTLAPGPAVEIRSLGKSYGAVQAVADLDLTVPAGRVVGLLGPNGAGKTTTLSCLLGALRPDKGVVRVLGRDPVRDRRSVFARTGVVFQHGGMYQRLRVAEAMSLFAALYPDPRDPCALVDELGLAHRSRTRFGALSGGEQTRLLLGLALVGNPSLLVLDEPTTGLDPQARRDVWSQVRAFGRSGGSVLVTTHYIEEAEYHCDEVVLVDHGSVIASGPPPILLAQHGLGTRVEVDRQDLRPEALRSDDIVHHQSFDQRVALFVREGRTDAVLRHALTTDGDVMVHQRVAIRPATLEDLFLLLTGRRES